MFGTINQEKDDKEFIRDVKYGIIAVNEEDENDILYFKGFVYKPDEKDFIEIEVCLTEDPIYQIEEDFVLRNAPPFIVERYKHIAINLQQEGRFFTE